MTLTTSSSPCLFFLAEGVSPSVNTKVPCFPLGRLCVILRKEEDDGPNEDAQQTIKATLFPMHSSTASVEVTLLTTIYNSIGHLQYNDNTHTAYALSRVNSCGNGPSRPCLDNYMSCCSLLRWLAVLGATLNAHLSEAEISTFLFLLKRTNLVTASITHCTSMIRSPCRYEKGWVTPSNTCKYAAYVFTIHQLVHAVMVDIITDAQ